MKHFEVRTHLSIEYVEADSFSVEPAGIVFTKDGDPVAIFMHTSLVSVIQQKPQAVPVAA